VLACQAWLGHIVGGLALAVIGASAILAALVGSSTASAAAMGASIFPEMSKSGYKDELATAVIAVGGTLAILIPPSIVLIIYGVLTGTSIGRLFMAGVMPGVLTTVGLSITSVFLAKRHNVRRVDTPFSISYAWKESAKIVPLLMLIVIVLASIYFGIASPTEAAAFGVIGALVIGATQKTLTRLGIVSSFRRTIISSTMIILIIILSSFFGTFLSLLRITQSLLTSVNASGLSAGSILAIIVVILLILGMFMDQIAILALTMPIAFPLITSLGYDPIWFGIIVTKTVEIGLLSPPLGLNVYVVSGVTKVPAVNIFRGILPFIASEVIVLLLLIMIPDISLWLPNRMFD